MGKKRRFLSSKGALGNGAGERRAPIYLQLSLSNVESLTLILFSDIIYFAHKQSDVNVFAVSSIHIMPADIRP